MGEAKNGPDRRLRRESPPSRIKTKGKRKYCLSSRNTILAIPNLKKILMSKWHQIENQPSLREIYKEKPIISYKKGKSLKDILVRAKL